MHDLNGDPVWLLRATTDLLRDVPDVPATYELLSAFNAVSALSSLVYDAAAGTVKLACSFPVVPNIAEWSMEMFTWAAAIQVNFAEACLGIADIHDFGGKPDQTAHPTSGTRQHPDEMVRIVQRAVVPLGEEGPRFGADDFLPLRDLPNSPSLETSADETGLTAEFPTGAYSGMLREIFGPRGKPHTAMLRMTTRDRHTLLGNGCLVRLRLPLELT